MPFLSSKKNLFLFSDKKSSEILPENIAEKFDVITVSSDLKNWTSNGINATFSDNFDWINGGGTMSYFKIDEQMHAWIDRNLN